jgi:hypothetical protein
MVSITFWKLTSKLHAIGLSLQLFECIVWSATSLFNDFIMPTFFHNPSYGFKVLDIPIGSPSFMASAFIKDLLLKYVKHVDLLFMIDNALVTFEILIRCFMQH